MRISVAMATFNGATHLDEQLKSLCEQVVLPHELVVCDDGSTDHTVAILESFAASAPFPVRIFRNEERLGYADNFLKAAKLCEGDWIAFCDQDDVWLPYKLEAVADALARHPDICIVLQNAELCDESLAPRGNVFPDRARPGVYSPNKLGGLFTWYGFLETIRADLIKLLPCENRPPNYSFPFMPQSHDRWVLMIANALGGVCVLGPPVAYYRRHRVALTGMYERRTWRDTVRHSLTMGKDLYQLRHDVALKAAAYLREQRGVKVPEPWADAFAVTASWYERMAEIYALRAELYCPKTMAGHLVDYIKIWLQGGYLGPRFIAMGPGSAGKDLFVITLGRMIAAGQAR